MPRAAAKALALLLVLAVLAVLALLACGGSGDGDRAAERQAGIAAYRQQLATGTLSPFDRATAAWRLGELLNEDGRAAEAVAPLEEAHALFVAAGDPWHEACVLLDLGESRFDLGHLAQAEAAWGLALDLYRQLGAGSGEASALRSLGLVAATRGEADTALDRYHQALDRWRQVGAPPAEGGTLQALGSLYSRLGRDAEAVEYLTEALYLLPTDADRSRAALLVSLAVSHHLTGDGETALGELDEALALYRRAADRLGEAVALDHRGLVLRGLGRHREARRALRSALRGFRRAGAERSEAHTLANLAWLALDEEEPAQARDLFTRAQERFVAAGDERANVFIQGGLGAAARALGDLDTAVDELTRAVDGLEELRREVPGRLGRGYFVAVRYDEYEQLATLHADLDRRRPGRGHARRALEVAEAARSRSLLDRLAADAGQAGDANARRRLLAESRALEERRLEGAPDPGAAPTAVDLAAEIRRRWLALERLEPAPLEPVPPLPADAIQALLDDDTLVLVYLLAEPESLAWSVDRGGVELHRLAGEGEIERRARRAAAALHAGAAPLAEVALAHLAEAVVAPLAGRLAGKRRLAVLADGALHLVPFAALPRPGGGEPLLAGHEIAALPSVTVLAALRQRAARRRPAASLLAAVADPVVTAQDARLETAAAPADAASPNLQRTLDDLDLQRLARLPAAGREAQAIVALAPPGSALLATGFDANRALVLGGRLAGFRIVHFATHGLVHPVHPAMSGVVLSLYDAEGRPQAGFLQAADLARLDLEADLVVLSACRTASGAEVRGEGMVGLLDAVFAAGTERVVASLWKVGDEATADLMQDLYRHLLAAGEPPAAALRHAQLAARGRGEPVHAWAAFQLYGDWRPLPNLPAADGVRGR